VTAKCCSFAGFLWAPTTSHLQAQHLPKAQVRIENQYCHHCSCKGSTSLPDRDVWKHMENHKTWKTVEIDPTHWIIHLNGMKLRLRTTFFQFQGLVNKTGHKLRCFKSCEIPWDDVFQVCSGGNGDAVVATTKKWKSSHDSNWHFHDCQATQKCTTKNRHKWARLKSAKSSYD